MILQTQVFHFLSSTLALKKMKFYPEAQYIKHIKEMLLLLIWGAGGWPEVLTTEPTVLVLESPPGTSGPLGTQFENHESVP